MSTINSNYSDLLKYDNSGTNIIEEKTDRIEQTENILSAICRHFCTPTVDYNVNQSLEDLERYVSLNLPENRLLYSHMNEIIYSASDNDCDIMTANIATLMMHIENTSTLDENVVKLAYKIYDHFHLVIAQVAYSDKIINKAGEEMASKAIDDSVKQAEEKMRGLEREYITILGIFASIVIAFVGGLSFSTSVISNINGASVYKLILMVLLLALIIISVIYLMTNFICIINKKRMPRKCIIIPTSVTGGLLALLYIAWKYSLLG